MELYNFKERNRSRTWPTPPTDFINSSLTCKHLLESNGMEFKENSIVGQTPRNARDLYNKTAAQILSDSLLKDQIKNDNFDYYMNIPINDEPSLKFKNSSSYPSVKKEFMSTFITLPLDNNKSSSFGETNDSFISTKKSTPNNHRSTKTSRFNLRKQHRRNAWGTSSYADLITQAISSSPEMKMTLMQIYDWIIQNIPFFKDKTDPVSSSGWKNSIRHNLSLHSRFVRIQTDVNGKSGYWTLIEKVGIGKLKSAGIKLSNEQLNDIDYLFLPKNEQDHSVSLLNPLNKKFTTSLNREQNVTSTSSTQPVRFAQINNKNCNFIPNDSQSSNLSLQQSYTNPYHQSSLNSIMFDDGSNISFNQSINNSHILSVSNNTNDFLATPSSSNLCLSTSNNSTPASSNFLSPFRINTGTNNRHRSLSNDNCPLEDVLSSDSDGLINSNLRYHYSSIVHNEKNSNMNQSLKHLHNFHSVNDIDFMLLDKSVNVNALGNNNLSQSSCNSSVSSFYHTANNSTFANNENNNNVDSKISRNNKFPCHSLNNLSSNSLLLDNFSSNYYDAISDGQPFINAPTNRLLGQNNGETGLIDNLTRSVIDVMNIVSPQVKKRSSSFLESNMKVENDTTLYDLNNNYNKINQMRIFNENLLNHSSPDMINNNSSNVKRQLFPSKDIKLIVTDPSNKIKSTEHLLSNQQSSHLKYNCVHSLQQPTINSESVNKPSSLLTNETVKVTFFNGESRDIPSDLSDLIVDKIFDDYDENLLNNIIHQDILSQTEDVVWKNTTVVVNNNCPNIPILVTSDINNNNSNDKNQ